MNENNRNNLFNNGFDNSTFNNGMNPNTGMIDNNFNQQNINNQTNILSQQTTFNQSVVQNNDFYSPNVVNSINNTQINNNVGVPINNSNTEKNQNNFFMILSIIMILGLLLVATVFHKTMTCEMGDEEIGFVLKFETEYWFDRLSSTIVIMEIDSNNYDEKIYGMSYDEFKEQLIEEYENKFFIKEKDDKLFIKLDGSSRLEELINEQSDLTIKGMLNTFEEAGYICE